MKKILFILNIFLLGCSANGLAQTKNEKAYEKNLSVISAGYGFINVWKIYLDKVFDIPGYIVKSTGPVTLLYEYALTNRFSAGLSASYSRVNGKAEKYQISDQISFISLLARADYHFLAGKKVDPYIGGGLGISNSKYKNLDTHTVIPNANKNVPSTLDFSAQLGVKYYFFKAVGVYVEAGYVNGAILHLGVAAKF